MAEEEHLEFHEESSNENNEEKSRDLQAEISNILGFHICFSTFPSFLVFRLKREE